MLQRIKNAAGNDPAALIVLIVLFPFILQHRTGRCVDFVTILYATGFEFHLKPFIVNRDFFNQSPHKLLIILQVFRWLSRNSRISAIRFFKPSRSALATKAFCFKSRRR